MPVGAEANASTTAAPRAFASSSCLQLEADEDPPAARDGVGGRVHGERRRTLAAGERQAIQRVRSDTDHAAVVIARPT